MGMLGKDLLRLDKDLFEFTVLFSADGFEIEDNIYTLGEITTCFLNYDGADFLRAVEEKPSDINRLAGLLRAMPLYGDMALGTEMGALVGDSKNEFAQNCAALGADIQLIQERYGWFLREMFHRDIGLRTQNRYAVQIDANGLSALVSGRSLGGSTERDPVSSAVQFEVRQSAADGEPRLFEKLVFTRLSDFIYVELFRAMMRGNCPKPCKNCGRWFLKGKTDTYEYCGGIAPDEEAKTCRDVGATASFQSKVRENEVWRLHQRAYKKYYARVLKHNMTKADFNVWALEAEALRDSALKEYEQALVNGQPYPLAEYAQELNRP